MDYNGEAIRSSSCNGLYYDEAYGADAFNFRSAVGPCWSYNFQPYNMTSSGVSPPIFDHAGGGSAQTNEQRCYVEGHQEVVNSCVYRLSRLANQTTFGSNDDDGDDASRTLSCDPRRLFAFTGGNSNASRTRWSNDDVDATRSPDATSDCCSVTSSTNLAAAAEYHTYDDYSQLRQSITLNGNESSLLYRWGSSSGPLRRCDVTPSGHRVGVDVFGNPINSINIFSSESVSSLGESTGWTKMQTASTCRINQNVGTIDTGLHREQYNYERQLLPVVVNPVNTTTFQHQQQLTDDATGDSYSSLVAAATTTALGDPCSTVPVKSVVRRKPKDALVPLIGKAIISSADCRMSLADICRYITGQSADYRQTPDAGPAVGCWQNNVRHTLSHYEFFVKSGRLSTGRGNYWTVHSVCRQRFAEGDFRIKRARHAVQIHEKHRQHTGDSGQR